MKAQELLATEPARKKFIRENFPYIEPREIVLNSEEVDRGKLKDIVHYIPIKETLKFIYGDKTYQAQEHNLVRSEMKLTKM